MTYLIFGGAGFIGINFVKLILSLNVKIVVFDKLTEVSNKKEINNLVYQNKIIFINEDICNYEKVFFCIKKFEPTYIINFAAETHVDNSIKNPDSFISTNIVGTYTILKALQSFKNSKYWNNFRYLNISTDEVYGSLGKNDPPFTEGSKMCPNSPYSASKASADHLVRSYFKTFGLPVLTSNCSNNFGPFQHVEKLIPLTIDKCLNLQKIPIYGNGKNVRDWIFVRDHCNVLKLILENGKLGEVYNIGGGQELKNIDLVKMICEYFDKSIPQKSGKKYSDLISFVDDRPGHDQRYAVNNKKITSHFGWNPSTSFKDNLETTIKWYIENNFSKKND